ncbi:MAG: hypothetical protein JJV92_06910, partial [Desulfosarcina sp.]|nr:hypothetical protein [Desulfobacterales bacterium]
EFEPTALFGLGYIKAVQGDKKRALTYLERLKQIDGAEAETHRNKLAQMLGQTYR